MISKFIKHTEEICQVWLSFVNLINQLLGLVDLIVQQIGFYETVSAALYFIFFAQASFEKFYGLFCLVLSQFKHSDIENEHSVIFIFLKSLFIVFFSYF